MTASGRASQSDVRDYGSRRLRLAGPLTSPLLVVLVLCGPSIASADILVFTTGRTMSVASSRLEEDRLVVALRGGGEASFARALIARVELDEVPYPSPPTEGVGEETVAAPGSLAAGPDTLDTVPGARPYAELIAASAATYGVDARLVHAVIEAESNYQPRARSAKGAKGLMQLMPATARQYAVRDPYDPRTNIDAGVRHLKDLLTRFDVGLALAAYNAGEATVRRFGGLPPYAETRSYVSRILHRVGR
jgi:soluble lytic murein transglycosylase-like protein